jgi:hypothetical protein
MNLCELARIKKRNGGLRSLLQRRCAHGEDYPQASTRGAHSSYLADEAIPER